MAQGRVDHPQREKERRELFESAQSREWGKGRTSMIAASANT